MKTQNFDPYALLSFYKKKPAISRKIGGYDGGMFDFL